MKFTTLFLGVAAAAVMYSCSSSDKPAENTVKKDSSAAGTYAVALDSSTLMWKGNMTGMKAYSHFGTIKLTEGSLVLDTTGAVSGGGFAVDMKSINPTDSAYDANPKNKHGKADLVGHLSAGDFFLVDSFPTAKFEITKSEGNTITGNLTVRGKTNEEKVTDVVITNNGGKLTATGKLVFDRQKYGVAFKVPMKDMILADNIELTVNLAAARK